MKENSRSVAANPGFGKQMHGNPGHIMETQSQDIQGNEQFRMSQLRDSSQLKGVGAMPGYSDIQTATVKNSKQNGDRDVRKT